MHTPIESAGRIYFSFFCASGRPLNWASRAESDSFWPTASSSRSSIIDCPVGGLESSLSPSKGEVSDGSELPLPETNA